MSEEPKASIDEVREAEIYRKEMGLNLSELSRTIGYSSQSGYNPASNPMTRRTYLAVKGLYWEWLQKQPKLPALVEPVYYMLSLEGPNVTLKPFPKEIVNSLSSLFR